MYIYVLEWSQCLCPRVKGVQFRLPVNLPCLSVLHFLRLLLLEKWASLLLDFSSLWLLFSTQLLRESSALYSPNQHHSIQGSFSILICILPDFPFWIFFIRMLDLFFKKKLILFYLIMYRCLVCMYVCALCTCSVHRGQRMVLDPPELKL